MANSEGTHDGWLLATHGSGVLVRERAKAGARDSHLPKAAAKLVGATIRLRPTATQIWNKNDGRVSTIKIEQPSVIHLKMNIPFSMFGEEICFGSAEKLALLLSLTSAL